MKKIEIIRKAVISNEEKIAELKAKRRKVEEAKTDALSRVYMKYFGECLVDDDTIEVSDTYCYFKRFDPECNYHKEIISISVRPSSWRDEEADKIETSFYSTSANNEFELKRMILIGKVGQIVLDFQDDIIAEYNSTRASFKDEITEFNKEIWALEKKVREMESEIREIEHNALMKKVESDGVTFEIDEENLYKLPDLDIRFNWTIKNITKLRVTDKTKSGKSADIEVQTVHNGWNSDNNEYELVYRDLKFQRVRMDKIDYLLDWNREKIVSS